MCGFCGLVMRDGSAVPPGLVDRMTTTLQHRGPDDGGVLVDGNVALGHRRLSIIDLSSAGHQPMYSDDGAYAIVFNGEVYNFRELRQQLLNMGYTIRSGSDTEVVLKAFIAWGKDAFAMLNGMFAFAIWDRSRGALTLCRDRFGIKPLFYTLDSHRLLFGSEPKALRVAAADGHTEVDPQGLAEYLYYGNSLGGNSLVRGLRRLLPGQWLELTKDQVQLGCYWELTASRQQAVAPAVAVRNVRQLLEAAVRRQLVSDVPIGVFLSGGVDSTAVVAAATQSAGARLDTYTVRFDFSEDSSDVVMARRVAQQFSTNHHELDVAGYKLEEVLLSLIDAHDLPFGDAANVPLYLLSQALGGNPKVILQGDGGDELFAGYRRYALLSRIGYLAPLARLARPLLQAVPQAQLRARLDRMAWALSARDPAERMARLLTEEKPDAAPYTMLSTEWRDQLANHDPMLRYREVAQSVAHLDPVQAMLYTDCKVLLPDIFLEKVDRSTMAHGIEVRVPLLDHELADYVLGLPSRLKVRHGELKWVFKQALAGLVPEYVLRRPKAGFGVPYWQWLRGPLRPLLESLLLDPVTDRFRLFDRRQTARRIEEHMSGTRNHGFMLWKLLELGLWQNRLGRAA